MNWEALGALGEISGAIAVLISILYLATQIRENTKQTKLQTGLIVQNVNTSATEAFSRFRAFIISDPEIAAIWGKASEGLSKLDSVEKERADKLIQEYFVTYQLVYANLLAANQEQDSAGIAEWMKESMVDELSRPGVREWWRLNSHRFNTLDYPERMNKIVDSYESLPN